MDAALQPGNIIPGGRDSATGIKRVMPGDDVEHQRVIGDRPRQRADMVEREGQREDAAARYQTIGRLQPDNAAGAGRVAHAAAGVAAERHRKQTGGDARPRARR